MYLRKFFGLSSGLAGTERFSNASLIHRESVLEHIGQVCLCCYFILHELDATDVLAAEVMKKAAIHDVEEVLTGDIPRSVKYTSSSTRQAFSHLQEEAMKKIAASLELRDAVGFILSHHQSKIGKSGLIVEIADLLAVVYKIHHEAIERGNKAIVARISTCQDHFDKIEEELDGSGYFSESEIVVLLNILEQARLIIAEASEGASQDQIKEAAE